MYQPHGEGIGGMGELSGLDGVYSLVTHVFFGNIV